MLLSENIDAQGFGIKNLLPGVSPSDALRFDQMTWTNVAGRPTNLSQFTNDLGISSSSIVGTVNYIAKFNGVNSVGISQIFDNGTGVGIGTASLEAGLKLHVNGDVKIGAINSIVSSAADGFTLAGTTPTYIPHYGLKWGNPNGGTPQGYLSGFNGINLITGGAIRLNISSVGIANFSNNIDVNGSVNIAAGGAYYIGSKLFAASSTNYNVLYRADNIGGIYLGATGDPNSYYDNTSHIFRNSSGLTSFAQINSGGINLFSGKISNLANGTLITDAVNKGQLDSVQSSVANQNGNWGQLELYAAFSNANTINRIGATFLQGSTNAPTWMGATEGYQQIAALGSNYDWAGTTANSYAQQTIIGRNTTTPYFGVRWKEGGIWGAWTKIWSGFSDNSALLNGLASSSFGQLANANNWANTNTFNSNVVMGNATAPLLQFSAVGVLAPTFTTRSVGTKIVLFPQVSGTNVDFAIGIASGTLWNSVSTTSNQFQWFGGTSLAATLSGAGNLTLSGNLVAVQGSFSGQLSVANGTITGHAVNLGQLQNINASFITAGTIADVRLSSNVSLDNVNNNFSARQSINNGSVIKTPIDNFSSFNINAGHTNTRIDLLYDGNDNAAKESLMSIWASEPNVSFTGAGIGHNIKHYDDTGTAFSRKNTTQYAEYIRFIDGKFIFNSLNVSGTVSTPLTLDGTNAIFGGWVSGANATSALHFINRQTGDARYVSLVADNTIIANNTITSGNHIRFPHANQMDTNDGRIGSGLFVSGLNIVGTQTVASQGRRVSIFGDIIQTQGRIYSPTSIEAGTQFISNIVTGTAPLSIASTTLVNNLNVQFLNGLQSSDFARLSNDNVFAQKIAIGGAINSSFALTLYGSQLISSNLTVNNAVTASLLNLTGLATSSSNTTVLTLNAGVVQAQNVRDLEIAQYQAQSFFPFTTDIGGGIMRHLITLDCGGCYQKTFKVYCTNNTANNGLQVTFSNMKTGGNYTVVYYSNPNRPVTYDSSAVQESGSGAIPTFTSPGSTFVHRFVGISPTTVFKAF